MSNFYEVKTLDNKNVFINPDSIQSFIKVDKGYHVFPHNIKLDVASFMSALTASESGLYGFTPPEGTKEVSDE